MPPSYEDNKYEITNVLNVLWKYNYMHITLSCGDANFIFICSEWWRRNITHALDGKVAGPRKLTRRILDSDFALIALSVEAGL